MNQTLLRVCCRIFFNGLGGLARFRKKEENSSGFSQTWEWWLGEGGLRFKVSRNQGDVRALWDCLP